MGPFSRGIEANPDIPNKKNRKRTLTIFAKNMINALERVVVVCVNK